jgi:hypothetical protein
MNRDNDVILPKIMNHCLWEDILPPKSQTLLTDYYNHILQFKIPATTC